ncbi:cell envelope integrity protein TolA [Saccharicrinis aurantiacus]|uniref:cell envelope integrity protein TolA n=1 Tax=Saccharicrinis aurantiacus TaxID=1849719 RepID=UPI0024911708|nr:cell envelope integrity protein TolA [Saccharicrinis aurantiacus]
MEKKYNKQGVIGSVIFHAIILLILIFFGLKALPNEEEGILVNLGNVQTGQGKIEPPKASTTPSTPPVQKTTPPPKPVEESSSKSEENVKTQDFEEAPVVKTKAQLQKEKEEKKKREEEKAKQKRKEEEDRKKRLEEERIANEKAIAEAKAVEEKRLKEEAERKKREEEQRIKDEARNNVGSAFGKSNSTSVSEGDAGGSGNQGYVTGDPNSTNRTGSGLGNSGNGADLTGRSLVGGLPQPEYNIQEQGVVVISIKVNRSGIVTSAEYEFNGSSTQNQTLIAAAKKAAMKAKFNRDSSAAMEQKGTIRYTFELN